MRVIHINLAKGWRGGERQTLLLMQGLRARGVESILVARAGEPLENRAREAGFEVLPARGAWPLRVKGNLVHAHEARAVQAAALWKLVHRRPVVATRRVDFSPRRGVLTRLKYNRVDRIAAISEGVASVMREWGVDASRMRIIHSAVLTDDLSRPERVAELRSRFAGRTVIGCVAAFSEHKDHATILRAAKHVQETNPQAVFLLLGEGELRGTLETQARSLGLNNVVFEGFQADPYSYYKIFDMFLLTSREEGLGTSILDAFVYGVPVVATRAGGIPELVKDAETGVLCSIGDDRALADAVLRLLGDDALRQRLVAGASKYLLSEFTVDRMTARYLDLYNECLALASRGSPRE